MARRRAVLVSVMRMRVGGGACSTCACSRPCFCSGARTLSSRQRRKGGEQCEQREVGRRRRKEEKRMREERASSVRDGAERQRRPLYQVQAHCGSFRSTSAVESESDFAIEKERRVKKREKVEDEEEECSLYRSDEEIERLKLKGRDTDRERSTAKQSAVCSTRLSSRRLQHCRSAVVRENDHSKKRSQSVASFGCATVHHQPTAKNCQSSHGEQCCTHETKRQKASEPHTANHSLAPRERAEASFRPFCIPQAAVRVRCCRPQVAPALPRIPAAHSARLGRLATAL